MSTASPDMLSIDRHTSLYGPRKTSTTPEAQATARVIQYLRESEVMPLVEESAEQPTNDPRPPSAAGAARLNQIADLIRSLTYGEMMELADQLWLCQETTDVGVRLDLTKERLPGIWHRWSAQ